ncbi:MAG: transglycosylase domain-containing protein, partial [Bdellovibrionota bacterium]
MGFSRLLAGIAALGFLAIAGIAAALISFSSSLPQIIKVDDYKPLLVSEVYARGGEKIGEYYRERRILTPFDKMPKRVIDAFIAAEDGTFFEHGGVNYVAIVRAFLVNLTSGEKRQGASTITQQVARSLLLSSEKTYTRKVKEILLAQKMEENLSKQDILFLYLNQIYFGEGAYGVAAAADTYFRKTPDQLNLEEAAILAGLPQAPTSYSPIKYPLKAKARQRYVLGQMRSNGAITKEEYEKAINAPITVYVSKDDKQITPYFIETLRQMLVQSIGEKALLDEGLKIHTSIDYAAQVAANKSVQEGLRGLDKRQGYRGPLKNLATPEEQEQF